ncbi:MAG: LysR family transcriptional regulator [Clostridia bacterium]|jgi:DNA-binding transcriptional LysR family regulator|nr:LysR family transcriptional regulator [Clostridia bacterium]MBT7122581.1 LysR family transcriptional regulator [Clostridia bacterium]
MNINTELYKTFYSVANYKSISKAAKAMFVSQPAVTKAIQKLENQTNCTLFIRNSKGVSLTFEGQLLFASVQKAFVHLQNAERTIENLANNEIGCIKIGVSNTLCKYYFLPHLEKFHKTYPHISIQIVNVPSPTTLALIGKGDIDFGIVSFGEHSSRFNYIRLMNIHDVFVSSKEVKSTTLPIEKLRDYPVMMLEKGNQTRILVDKFLSNHGVVIEPEIEIGSMDFLIEFAKIGIGVACVIKEFVEQELCKGELFQLPLSAAPPPREMGLVTNRKIALSHAAKNFVDMLLT